MKNNLLNIIVLSIIFFNLKAQEPFFRNITTDQGLPSNEVYKILDDSKGYIWGISDGGVFCFNGKEFKVYTTDDGIPDNTILTIYEGKDGKMWITGFNGRVGYIQNEKITQIPANDTLQKLLKTGLIYLTATDKNHNLWLGTNASMYMVSSKSNYRDVTLFLENDTISSFIREVSPGELISSKNYTGLKKVYEKIYIKIETSFLKTITDIKLKQNSLYNRITLLKDKTIAMSVHNNVCLLHPDRPQKTIHTDGVVNYIYQDLHGGVWLCLSKSGLLYYPDINNEKIFSRYLDKYTPTSVLEDKEGGFWVSTIEKGVFYIPNNNVMCFKNDENLNNNIVEIESIDESVWVITNDNTTLEIKPDNTIRVANKIKIPLSQDNINIYKYKNKYYITGYPTYYTPDNFKTQVLPSYTVNGNVSSTDVIFENDSLYWLLSYNVIKKVIHDKEEKEYRMPGRAKHMIISSDNKKYIGMLMGLYEFKDEKFQRVAPENQLLGTRINYIKEGASKKLFLCTNGKGLLIYTPKKTTQITIKEGLANNICNFITTKDNLEFWVGTKSGLSRVRFTDTTYNNYEIKNFTTANGLINNNIVKIAIRGTEIWMATKEGLMYMRNSDKVINTVPPPLILKRIEVNSQPIPIENIKYIELEYDQNNLQLFIDNLTFKSFGIAPVTYKLEGYDKSWQQTNTPSIVYQNLTDKKYVFTAYGINSNGYKSTTPIVLYIKINPPYWKRWWFVLLCIVALVTVSWTAVIIRIKQIQKRVQEKAEINKKITEYQILALRAQMNPHFVFNAINGIQRYILQSNVDDAYDYLTKFSKLIRIILENVNESNITLEEEIETLKLYIDLELLRFENKFEYEIEIDTNIETGTTMIPGMIIQPFVENAIWHGIMPLSKDRVGKIKVIITENSNELLITIEDNGIGRKKASEIKNIRKNKSLGINLTSKRLEVLNGKKSQIKVTDLYDNKYMAIGTRVEINIPHIND